VHLSRTRACDAIPVGLPPVAAALLGAGPTTTVTVQRPDGSLQVIGGPERQEYIDELAGTVRSFAAKGPFWPGNGLTEPPAQPAVMPYKPYHS
jgi:hypothetical protein